MANVTQLIPNYLGGVSRIPDFNKQPNQVRDLTNGYPDLTYGLLKRPGTEILTSLPAAEFPLDVQAVASFHVIDREGDPLFLVVLHEGFLKVFNMETGKVYESGNGLTITPDLGYTGYRTPTSIPRKNQFDIVSDDRRTVIVNRTMRVEKYTTLWEPSFQWAGTRSQDLGIDGIRPPLGDKYRTAGSIGELPDSSAKTIDLIDRTKDSPPNTTPLRKGWHILATSRLDFEINQDQKGAGLTVKCYIDDDGIIDSTKDLSIVSPGYNYYQDQPLKIDGTEQQIRVTTGLECGYVYHVTGPSGNGNNTDKSDDYYMIPFSSRSNLLDTFFWVEGPQPTASKGLDNITLPYELVYDRVTDTFKYQQIDYSYRWCGNEYTNPDPSFVGVTIDSAFFFNNRLGFLSEDNVILSRPITYTEVLDPDDAQDIEVPTGNPYVKRNPREIDFFTESSIQQNDGDPIDMSAANNNISKFSKAFSSPGGVVLFADGQQSLLSSNQNGAISPNNAEFSNLSVYECDPNVKAVAMDQDFYFLDQSEASSRLFRMRVTGQQAVPQVLDITRDVQDWCPNDIDTLSVVQSGGMLIISRRDLKDVYIYRQKGDYASWFKWTLPFVPMYIYSKHDDIYFVMKRDNNNRTLIIARAQLFLYPNSEVVSAATTGTSTGRAINPYLDLYYVPAAADVTATATELTVNIPADYPNVSGGQLAVVTFTQSLTPSGALYSVTTGASGMVRDATRVGNTLTATGDFRGFEDKIIFGYRYTFDVELPTFFFRSEQGADYTAYLTVARAKFALSLSGDFSFQVQGKGKADWIDTEAFTSADYYLADTAPMDFESIIQVPIHQRNTNFRMKLTSDSPFPLSLSSCMWEGNYSPRYYRRV